MSLNQCWASRTNINGVDNIYNPNHLLLWNEFCPEFPWVGPLAFQNANDGDDDSATDGEATTNYLGEYWVTTGEIQTVHFRQFGWTDDGDDEGKESRLSSMDGRTGTVRISVQTRT